MRQILIVSIFLFASFAPTLGFAECLLPKTTEDLLQEISFRSGANPRTVVFGQKDIGFFEAPLLKTEAGRFMFRFLPVTYKRPMIFFERDSQGRLGKILEKKFDSPFGCFEHPVRLTGRLSSPFFFLSWTDRNSAGGSAYFPSVLNRLGEMVWAHIGYPRRAARDWNYYAQEVEGGLLILGQYEQSQIANFQFDGRVLDRHDFVKEDGIRSLNHSFNLAGADRAALLKGDTRRVSLFRDYLVDFRSFGDLLGWIFRRPRRFFGNELVLFDLKKKTSRVLYSTFDVFDTRRDVPLHGAGDLAPDPFLEPGGASDSELLKSSSFEDYAQADVDWSHENSVDFDPRRGYLITVLNFSTVVWLDPQGRFLGTFGSGPKSTWKWPEGSTPFSMPHSARFFGDSILLYDNANDTKTRPSAKQSRVLLFRKDPAKDGRIELQKEIPLPGVKSVDRGSVRALSGSRILVYLSRAFGSPIALQEYDLEKSERTASLEIEWPFARRSQDGIPLGSLGFPAAPSGLVLDSTRAMKVKDLQVKGTPVRDWSRPLEEDVY